MVQSFDNRDLEGGGQSGLPANLDIILPADENVKRGDVVGAISGKVYKCAPGKTFAQIGPSYGNAIWQTTFDSTSAASISTCLKTFSDGKSLVLYARNYRRTMTASEDLLCIYDEAGTKISSLSQTEVSTLAKGEYVNSNTYVGIVPSHTKDEFITIMSGSGQSSLLYSAYIISIWNSDLEVVSTFEIDTGVTNTCTSALYQCNFIWSNDRLFCIFNNTTYYLKVCTIDTLNESIVTDVYTPSGMNYSTGSGYEREISPGPIWLDDAKTKFVFVYYYHTSNVEQILFIYDSVAETIVTDNIYYAQSSFLSYARHLTNTLTYNNSQPFVDVDTSCGWRISDTRIVYLTHYSSSALRVVVSDIDLDTMVETIAYETTIGTHYNAYLSAFWLDGDYLYHAYSYATTVYGACIDVINGTTKYTNLEILTLPYEVTGSSNYLDLENKKYYMFAGASLSAYSADHNYNMLVFNYSPSKMDCAYITPPTEFNSDISTPDNALLIQGVFLVNKLVYVLGNFSNGSTIYSDGLIYVFDLETNQFQDMSDYKNDTYAANPNPYVFREVTLTSSYPAYNPIYYQSLQGHYCVILDAISFKVFDKGLDLFETYNTMYKVFSKEFKATDIPIIGVALTDVSGGNVKVRINGYTRLNDEYKNIWKDVDHTSIDGGKIRVMSTHAIIGE